MGYIIKADAGFFCVGLFCVFISVTLYTFPSTYKYYEKENV